MIASISTITRKHVNEMLVASIRFRAPYSEVGEYIEKLAAQVPDYLIRGPFFLLHHDDCTEKMLDAEICVPVTKAIEIGEVATSHMPACDALMMEYTGPFGKCHKQAWQALQEYAREYGLPVHGPFREVFKNIDTLFPDRNHMLLELPLCEK